MSWSSGLCLKIVRGQQQGLVLPLLSRSVMLGRATSQGESAEGFLFFYEATVSRQHAELCWDDRKKSYVLHQRSQTNKTLVNNFPVESKTPRPLAPGDTIQMGLLIVSLESA
jgi:pSer/pThr/pTyr-binding forkhead associated (FHA) protein